MKKFFILLGLGLWGLSLWGQQVTRAEYFWDADPGFGNATPLSVGAAEDMEITMNVPLEALEAGRHTLFVRARDENGRWSQCFRRSVLVVNFQAVPPLLTQVEYFFDEDPGFGQGIPLEIPPADQAELSVALPLETLADGIHTLYVRARDDKGSWGMVFNRTFLVQSFPQDQFYQITAAEYFFDEDPGFGEGMPLSFEPGALISLDVHLPLEDLPEGIHTLYVRARDDKGSWGQVFRQNFLKFFTQDEQPLISRMEYFINEDPGFGNGTPIPLNTPRETALKIFEVDAALVQPGPNTLYVRGLDTRGRWGLVYQTTFEGLESPPCDPPTDLTASDVTETTATLGWTEQAGGTSWDLLWGPNGMDHTEDGTVGTGIDLNPNTVEGLTQTTLYDFYVRTACSDGQVSPWAGPASFHTLPLPYNTLTLISDPPEGGTLSGEGSYAWGESITITAIPNANFVFQYWSGDTDFLDDPQDPTATVTMPAQPIALTAHFLDVTGISEGGGQGLRIFPNPARELLNVELFSKSRTLIIQLKNLQGQIVDQKEMDEPGQVKTRFNTSGLPAGLYVLVIRGEGINLTKKIIIQ